MKKILFVVFALMLLPFALAENEDGRITSGGNLIIIDLDVRVDGLSSRNLEYEDTIKRTANPGSEIEFNIELKNNHSTLDMTDIEIILEIDDLEIDEFLDSTKINNEKDETFIFVFTLPLDTEEDTYEVFIEAEGELNNTIHRVEFIVDLDVEEEDVPRTSVTRRTSTEDLLISINDSVKEFNSYYDPYTTCRTDLTACKGTIETRDATIKGLEGVEGNFNSCTGERQQKETANTALRNDLANCRINITQQQVIFKGSKDNNKWLIGAIIGLGVYAFWKYRKKIFPDSPAQSETK